MKKYLQIFLSLLLCAVLMLSCGCTINFFGSNDNDKDKDKNPSSSQQDETDSSDDGFSEDEGSSDDGLFDDSDDDDKSNDKETSSKKEYDKFSPVSSSGNIMPTVKDEANKDEDKEDDDDMVSDEVKYPESVNANALNKTDLFDTYDTALFTEKIWEGKTVYYETICFEQDKNGFISTASLLYEPDQIIAVRSADMKTTYTEGKDYTVEGRVITRPRGSTAPYLSCKSEIFVPYTGANRQYQLADDPANAIYFHEDGKVHQKNILTVFYTHKDGWRGNTYPETQENKLSKTLAKLKNGEDLKIVFHGDSITSGYTTSGDQESHRNLDGNSSPAPSRSENYAPYVSAYPSMVAEALKAKFKTANITKVNTAAPGGQSGSYGLEHIDLVTKENPDLVVIAFGMNDSWMDTGNNHGRYYYKNFYIQMMNKVLEVNPECEFIFVPCMLPNMDVLSFLQNDASFDSHEQHLYEIQKEYSNVGIAVVPTTSLWRDFYALGKKPSDYTGAMDNHPNDWGHSVYAQLILNAFGL